MDQVAHYQQLAQALIQVCPANFISAELEAQVGDDWSEIKYHCALPGGEQRGLPAPAAVDFATDETLHQLRKGMQQDGRTPWSRCTFRLQPDGQFKFDVKYDD